MNDDLFLKVKVKVTNFGTLWSPLPGQIHSISLKVKFQTVKYISNNNFKYLKTNSMLKVKVTNFGSTRNIYMINLQSTEGKIQKSSNFTNFGRVKPNSTLKVKVTIL